MVTEQEQNRRSTPASIRQWFAALTSTERSAVMGFQDERNLVPALLDLGATAENDRRFPSTVRHAQTSDTHDSNYPDDVQTTYFINWKRPVTMVELEACTAVLSNAVTPDNHQTDDVGSSGGTDDTTAQQSLHPQHTNKLATTETQILDGVSETGSQDCDCKKRIGDDCESTQAKRANAVDGDGNTQIMDNGDTSTHPAEPFQSNDAFRIQGLNADGVTASNNGYESTRLQHGSVKNSHISEKEASAAPLSSSLTSEKHGDIPMSAMQDVLPSELATPNNSTALQTVVSATSVSAAGENNTPDHSPVPHSAANPSTSTSSPSASIPATTIVPTATSAKVSPPPFDGDSQISARHASVTETTSGDAVDDVMNRLCAIFPAAFTFNSPESTSDDVSCEGSHAPFVTLHPQLMATLDGEQTLDILDRVIQCASIDDAKPTKFLSDAFRPAYVPWLNALQGCSSKTAASKPESKMTLCRLIILRFELAIHQSFNSIMAEGREEVPASGLVDELASALSVDHDNDGAVQERKDLLEAVVQNAKSLSAKYSSTTYTLDFGNTRLDGLTSTSVGIELAAHELLLSPVVRLALWLASHVEEDGVASTKCALFYRTWDTVFHRHLLKLDSDIDIAASRRTEHKFIDRRPPDSRQDSSEPAQQVDNGVCGADDGLSCVKPSELTVLDVQSKVNGSETKSSNLNALVETVPATANKSVMSGGNGNSYSSTTVEVQKKRKKKNKSKKKGKRKSSTADASTQTKEVGLGASPRRPENDTVSDEAVTTNGMRGTINTDLYGDFATSLDVDMTGTAKIRADASGARVGDTIVTTEPDRSHVDVDATHMAGKASTTAAEVGRTLASTPQSNKQYEPQHTKTMSTEEGSTAALCAPSQSVNVLSSEESGCGAIAGVIAARKYSTDSKGKAVANVGVSGTSSHVRDESPTQSHNRGTSPKLGNSTPGVAITSSTASQSDPSAATSQNVTSDGANSHGENGDDDDDAWETVGVKSKNRKRIGSSRFNGQQSFGSTSSSSIGGKKSKAPRSRASRKGNANRKMVREILSTVLDAVDEEIQKRRPHSTRKSTGASSRWPVHARCEGGHKNVSAASKSPRTNALSNSRSAGGENGRTMRNALLGKSGGDHGRKQSTSLPESAPSWRNTSDSARPLASTRARTNPRRGQEKMQPSSIDQNTAATVPETVSAVSTGSLTANGGMVRKSQKNQDTKGLGVNRSDSSLDDSTNQAKPVSQVPTSSPVSNAPPVSPPLPTLLNPETANSAGSSVASSLDAPHSSRHHVSSAMVKESDVGYHLLDVCERLTRDMTLFMHRRTHALSVRRAERTAVLNALHKTIMEIWSMPCTVEMYGSCATQLDLPSSDLDLVVCGLDAVQSQALSAASSSSQLNDSSENLNAVGGSPQESMSNDSLNALPRPEASPHRASASHHHLSAPMYGGLSINGERVIRLAQELECQPWAVHVKPIPSASVPVVKVLVDSSRLPGANGVSWLSHNQQQTNQIGAQVHTGGEHVEVAGPHQHPLPFHAGQSPPLWRGADVQNGLLKVDITFQGPEHGGIGSTNFSARVVQDFCMETGLPPEGTPAVQTLMVLKELLAQRRLNEPFSGGLSSYALLLLLVSIIRERSIIRAELDRVERQRRFVAEGAGTTGMQHRQHSEQSTSQLQQPTVTTKSGVQPSSSKSIMQPNSQPFVPMQTKSPSPPSKTTATQPASSERQLKPKSTTISTPVTSVEGVRNASPKKSVAGQSRSQDNVASTGAARRLGAAAGPVKANDTSRAATVTPNTVGAVPLSSWASVAKKSPLSSSTSIAPETSAAARSNKTENEAPVPAAARSTSKPGSAAGANAKRATSFADAVARGSSGASVDRTQTGAGTVAKEATSKTRDVQKAGNGPKAAAGSVTVGPMTDKYTGDPNSSPDSFAENPADQGRINQPASERPVFSQLHYRQQTAQQQQQQSSIQRPHVPIQHSTSFESSLMEAGHVFPHGFHDVIEVLCSGETTAGKLLMHFLLFYGQHFDSQATAIDYSGTHERDYSGNYLYSPMSPYIQRRSAGSYDPMTGMLTVDPIVVYDPLKGAENHNVARSCFAWSSIRWVFAQSYMTLSDAAEKSGTSGTSALLNRYTSQHQWHAMTSGNKTNNVPSQQDAELSNSGQQGNSSQQHQPQLAQQHSGTRTWSGPYSSRDGSGSNMLSDLNSPILERLLSF